MKHEGQDINPKTNSLIIIVSLIPSCFVALLSTTIAKKIGYQFMIRSCSLMFMISPLFINFSMNLIFFSIFWFLLPVVFFSLAAIPVINALWTQFPKDLNKVTGLAVLFFSIGMILWNVIFTFIVNPKNLKAKID
jgi:MFS family permease